MVLDDDLTAIGIGLDVPSGMVQRAKALATTRPLHDLDDHKSSIRQGDFSVYQMAELALQCIDVVTVSMDFMTGAKPEEVLEALARHAAAQAPDRDSSEHLAVATYVLDGLLNKDSLDRAFRHVYGTWGPNGFERAVFDFKLLEEVLGRDGEIHLRASDEAVNVLVGALEVDVAAAQQAADLRVERLIKRGRLPEAETAARSAQYLTSQLAQKLRRELEATARDIRTVDWAETMPRFLDEALDHVQDRIRAEAAILERITDIRDVAQNADTKGYAARLVLLVKDCLRRHDQLQNALLEARERFRREQDRQAFSSVPQAAAIDINGQLLQPALAATVAQIRQPAEAFFTSVIGVRAPTVLRLVTLFETLLTPPVERDLLGDLIVDPDLDESDEVPRFSEATYDHMEELLALDPDAPQRLSGLLADARQRQQQNPDVHELDLLVTIRVLALAAQEIGAARRHHDPYVMVAADDGTLLDDPVFAGADLLVGRAAVVHDELHSHGPAPATDLKEHA